MKLTDNEFITLSAYEEQFAIAMRSHYARGIGKSAAAAIHAVLTRVTGRSIRLNTSCAHCVYNLLLDAGKIYFADKAEREAQNAAHKVEVEEKAVKPRKAEIKTASSAAEAETKPARKRTTKK